MPRASLGVLQQSHRCVIEQRDVGASLGWREKEVRAGRKVCNMVVTLPGQCGIEQLGNLGCST